MLYLLRSGIYIAFFMVILTGCSNQQENKTIIKNSPEQTDIDQPSYNLGIIGAFAEVVGLGIKELALSAALIPEEMDALIEDARMIAEKNNVKIYREKDFLVTDLFPSEITEGKHVLLIYTGQTKQKYLDIKRKKILLEQSGEYEDIKRTEIAVSLGKLLSYPDDKINELINNNLNK